MFFTSNIQECNIIDRRFFVARCQPISKWLPVWRVGGILLPFLTRTEPTTLPLDETILYSPVLGAILPDVNLSIFSSFAYAGKRAHAFICYTIILSNFRRIMQKPDNITSSGAVAARKGIAVSFAVCEQQRYGNRKRQCLCTYRCAPYTVQTEYERQ